jgi:hypothetical protein
MTRPKLRMARGCVVAQLGFTRASSVFEGARCHSVEPPLVSVGRGHSSADARRLRRPGEP